MLLTRKDEALEVVSKELDSAWEKFPNPFASPHEGYAVLLEEVTELWDEVRRHNQDREAMRKEAIQVAAMAVRFLLEV